MMTDHQGRIKVLKCKAGMISGIRINTREKHRVVLHAVRNVVIKRVFCPSALVSGTVVFWGFLSKSTIKCSL